VEGGAIAPPFLLSQYLTNKTQYQQCLPIALTLFQFSSKYSVTGFDCGLHLQLQNSCNHGFYFIAVCLTLAIRGMCSLVSYPVPFLAGGAYQLEIISAPSERH